MVLVGEEFERPDKIFSKRKEIRGLKNETQWKTTYPFS